MANPGVSVTVCKNCACFLFHLLVCLFVCRSQTHSFAFHTLCQAAAWPWVTQETLERASGLPQPVIGIILAFARSSYLVAAGGYNDGKGKVSIYDTESRAVVDVLESPNKLSDFCSLAFFPEDKFLAAGSDGGAIIVWDLKQSENGHPVLKMDVQAHNPDTHALCALPNHHLASASYDKSVKIWNLDTGKCVREFTDHTKRATCLALLPDGSLVSGACDPALCVRQWQTGKVLERVELAEEPWSLAVSVEKNLLIVGGRYGKCEYLGNFLCALLLLFFLFPFFFVLFLLLSLFSFSLFSLFSVSQ